MTFLVFCFQGALKLNITPSYSVAQPVSKSYVKLQRGTACLKDTLRQQNQPKCCKICPLQRGTSFMKDYYHCYYNHY